MNNLKTIFNEFNDRILSHTQLAPLLDEKYMSYNLIVLSRHNDEVLNVLRDKPYIIEESSYYSKIIGEDCIKYQVFVNNRDPDIDELINNFDHFFYDNETRCTITTLIYSIKYSQNHKVIKHILNLIKESNGGVVNYYHLFYSIFKSKIEFNFNEYFKDLGKEKCFILLLAFSRYSFNKNSIKYLAMILRQYPELQSQISFNKETEKAIIYHLL